MALTATDAMGWIRRRTLTSDRWIERLARIGYSAKGLVYVVIGAIALQAGLRPGGDPEGSSGALQSIATQSLGRVMIAAVAIGLFGYMIWKLVQAILDPEGIGGDAKGNVTRLGYGISGIIHAGLAYEATRLALGAGFTGNDEASVDQRTAMLMEQPFGRWLVGIVGVGIALFALYEFYYAGQKDLAKRIRIGELDRDTRDWVIRLGRIGYASRAIVFAIIGYFVTQAAIHYNPSEARGLGEALEVLREQTYGPALLAIIAAGFVAYGFFAFVKAAFRQIQTP